MKKLLSKKRPEGGWPKSGNGAHASEFLSDWDSRLTSKGPLRERKRWSSLNTAYVHYRILSIYMPRQYGLLRTLTPNSACYLRFAAALIGGVR
jgi:hypothetical protein